MSDSTGAAEGVGELEPSINPTSVYLDSCFYLDYLKGDTPHHAALGEVLAAWKAGTLEVITSALTLTEVLWVKCEDDEARMLVDRAREPELLDLFKPTPPRRLILVELDRVIGESSRELVWERNIKPKDAIHIASALASGAETLFTCDKGLWRHSGKVGGTPKLQIRRPAWLMSPTFPSTEPLGESSMASPHEPSAQPEDPE